MIGFVLFVWGLVNLFLRVLAFKMVWNWFPHTILNVPQLSLASAFGLLLVIAFFKPLILKSKKENETFKRSEEEKLGNMFTVSISYGLLILVGYIVSLFV